MDVKIEWLEAFRQTAETKSLTKASEILHISQPALSKQIRTLEDELGAQLLVRSSTGVTLTQSGQILLERSKKIMNELNDLRREIALTQDEGKVDLVIGSWPSVATIFLPNHMAANQQEDTKMAFKIRVFYSFFDLIKNIETGTIDAALFDDRGVQHHFHSTLVFKENFFLFVNANHPLFGHKEKVFFHEIKDDPFVMLPEGCDVRMLVEKEFSTRGETLHIALEIELGQSILGFVQANLGITILPEIFINQTNDTIKAIPITDFGLTRQISVVTREKSISKQLLTLFNTSSKPNEHLSVHP
nr:LysR family transcriptional regulator [Paenibacillus anseongense]